MATYEFKVKLPEDETIKVPVPLEASTFHEALRELRRQMKELDSTPTK